MFSQTELTISNFGYYAFHPFSEELSSVDQKIALLGTILLGLTLGMGHLICRLFFYNRKIENITNVTQKSTNDQQSSSNFHNFPINTLDSQEMVNVIQQNNSNSREIAIQTADAIANQANYSDTNISLFKHELTDITIRHILPYLDPKSRAYLFEAEFYGKIQPIANRVMIAYINCINDGIMLPEWYQLLVSLKSCGNQITSLKIPDRSFAKEIILATPIEDRHIEVICSYCPKLISLNIKSCTLLSDKAMENITKLTNLSFLSVRQSRDISKKGIMILAKLTNLTCLNIIRHRNIAPAGWSEIATEIANLPKLTSLKISRGVMSNEVIKALTKLENLTTLSISECSKVTFEGLKLLKKMKHLKILDISYLRPSEEDDLKLEAISDFSQLTALNISGNSADAEKLSECLVKLNNLNSLSMAGCSLTEKTVDSIAQKLNLIYLDISGTPGSQWELIKESIGNLAKLEKLILNRSYLSDVTPLSRLQRLKYLEIKECKGEGIKEKSLSLLPENIVVIR